jgi:hypothetical protein
MDLVIKRSEWLRGEESSPKKGGSALLRSRDRKKCCLGFLSLACGLTEQEIEGKGYPAGAFNDKYESSKSPYHVYDTAASMGLVPEPLRPLIAITSFPNGLFFDNTDLLYQITRLNDRYANFDVNYYITEEVRESQLQQLFAEHLGVNLTFVD